MTETTLGELVARREKLEDAAAQVLGRMQFEFSRLDMGLGLCAVWIDNGRRLDELNPQVAAMTFHKRLEFIGSALHARFPTGTKARKDYQAWIDRAHAARSVRNQLIHGRWGVEPATEQVVNILCLPTSPDQREVKYTIAELSQLLDELRFLQGDLNELRKKWPL